MAEDATGQGLQAKPDAQEQAEGVDAPTAKEEADRVMCRGRRMPVGLLRMHGWRTQGDGAVRPGNNKRCRSG